ncbi:MAG TPA: hypothetical protein VE689_02910 [Candidatus Udaeobacter sp.]|jgi:hypothetical protein|nr:hypothetical protein [Candidatus Udaeobacter sp.]
MAVLCLPEIAFAPDLNRPAQSIQDLSIADIANNTIVVISQEETISRRNPSRFTD